MNEKVLLKMFDQSMNNVFRRDSTIMNSIHYCRSKQFWSSGQMLNFERGGLVVPGWVAWEEQFDFTEIQFSLAENGQKHVPRVVKMK